MQPVSARFLEVCRTNHAIVSTATHRDPFTGTLTALPIEAGSQVTVDVTAAIRRTLTLNMPPLQSLYDVLTVPGGEITVTTGIRFIDGTTETVPAGVFRVDQEQLGYAPGGQLQVTAPDRWLVVQRNAFGLKRSAVATNAAWQEIKRLVEGAWPNPAFPLPGWALTDQSAVTKVGPQVWQDGNREAAIQAICTANSVEVFFDANGLAVLRPVPSLTDAAPAVWTVDALDGGVLIDANRSRDFTLTRNAVIVSSTATGISMPPVEVKNTHDPAVDPLSTRGPLGYVPFEYSSPLIRTTAQATTAGKTLLQKQLGINGQITLAAAPNAALDGWDVIDVVLPPGDKGARAVEHHIIQSVTIPLTPDGQQQIGTRATRTSADDTV